ncbi:MAG: 6,7-dimethyl-8-ribityllumazine synthase [candidate division Zixibacteria bacterium RBG-1]|nr:MAG: 6,7-dimethyl-8-ribityllumazine synthase [candidate division Zixibacteria bacterium RBG-1]
MKTIKGKLDAKGKNFAIVVSRFNEFITQKLLEGALDCLTRHNTEEKNITVVWVPGAFEIPLMAQKLAKSRKFSAVICLGAILRGETPHFEFISNQVAVNIGKVALESDLPVIFGVITTENLEQAIERAGSKAGNKGWESALTAIEMANLSKEI